VRRVGAILTNKSGKGLTVLLPLVIAAAAYATPTASIRTSDVVGASCPGGDAGTPSASAWKTIEIGETCGSYLSNIADELLKPPGDSIDSPVPAVAATSLPAVPGALFMGLTGFLCVSLVRDRKIWIAALAGLLWAGQAGVTVLPQVAHPWPVEDTPRSVFRRTSLMSPHLTTRIAREVTLKGRGT
jgi:hypothetical protein